MSFEGITFYVTSQQAFIVIVVYFVIDSVRKLLVTSSHMPQQLPEHPINPAFESPKLLQCKQRLNRTTLK
jgi:hypothetical protein